MSGELGAKMSGEQEPNQNIIKTIENITCRLATDVSQVLERAERINGFFFGMPPKELRQSESKEPESAGWLAVHVDTLREINKKVCSINEALENACRSTESK